MVSVPLPVTELPDVGGLSVAAVNGPRTTVVSGPVAALDDLLALMPDAKRIPVDYASHSAHVEAIRERLLDDLADLAPRAPEIPFHSTATGERETRLDGGYWYRNLRETVRFAPVVTGLAHHGAFLEVSPHPVLTVGIEETLEDTGADVAVLTTLRRGDGGTRRLHTALAEAFVRGVPVDWRPLYPGARRTPLPTYPFQRTRFWLAPHTSRPGDGTGHPFLHTATRLADGDGLVLTGRLSLGTHPWLADHAVTGVTLLPGTAFVELAAHAAAETGCDRVDELVLEHPLALDDGPVTVQVTVTGVDDGHRRATVHSRRDGDPWTRNATATLSSAPREPVTAPDWPPPGAAPLDLDELADGLAAAGYEYGPAFHGLTSAWRDGDELYAEATTDLADAGAFALHPALLDVALHPAGAMAGQNGVARLPFAWHGVRHGTVGARTVRVHLRPAATVPDGVAVTVTDAEGTHVLSADAVVLRPVTTAGLGATRRLYHVDWTPAPPRAAGVTAARVYRVGGGTVRQATEDALRIVQDHLTAEATEVAVVVTDGAVATRPGEAVRDLAGAAVWGLVRSAQSEHPGRFLLADTADPDRVTGLLDPDEPEIAVRDGRPLVPRLTRSAPSGGAPATFGTGTVLVTGGSGTLGGLVARHLVTRHGVRSLVLASRSGTGPDLSDLDAEVRLAACDVGDRAALRALLDGIDDLTAVVHAAAALDDGVVTALTPERLDTALRPKADAALLLDELTRDRDLSAFVLYSSAAALFGTAGQANYAAANSVVDAVATRRRAAGLPAVSLAWGFWERRSALTAHLGAVDLHRLAGLGVRPLSAEHGLALFDAALASAHPVVVTANLDPAALTRRDAVPALLRDLVRAAPVRTTRDTGAVDLTVLSGEERGRALTDLVRTQAAAVLGHEDVDAVRPGQAFTELGFDSLTAVELRNRLAGVTGLRLATTLVFDHPTPAALAAHLGTRLAPADPGAAALSDLDRVLAGVGADQRADIAVRLRAVLAGWDEPVNDAPADVTDATDEELFDLIQQEFGKS
jgi:acyl transferase domain-containing protein/acyl carrier protein